MQVGDKVQFIRDVTWGDLSGKFADDYDKDEIRQEIWSVGTTTGDTAPAWTQIITEENPEGYFFPNDSFEIIPPPSPQ